MKKIRILHNEGYGTYRIEWRSPWWPFWSTPWWSMSFPAGVIMVMGSPRDYKTLEEAMAELRVGIKKDSPWVVVGLVTGCEKCAHDFKVLR